MNTKLKVPLSFRKNRFPTSRVFGDIGEMLRLINHVVCPSANLQISRSTSMVYGCEACVINRLPKKLNIYEHHEHLTSSECKTISKQLHHLPRMPCNAYVCTVCAVLATYTCISLCIIISQACHIQPSTGISTTNCPFSPFSPTLASRDSHRPLPFWPNGTVWTTHQTPLT